MASNVLSLHFTPSQASSSQNSNVDSYLQYCEVDSLKPSKSESSLHMWSATYFFLSYLLFFHRCVPHDQCGGLLNVRGQDDLVCIDTKKTCCHESVLKAANETSNSETDYYDQEQESCSSYENEGFR